MSSSIVSSGSNLTTGQVCLTCTRCSTIYGISNLLNCPACGGILQVEYPEGHAQSCESLSSAFTGSMWEFSSFLPPLLRKNVVTNGEGKTPLKPSRVAPNTVFFKDESKNPTGSFKDRPTSVCVSMAKKFGCTKIVTASSGNGAAAAACYASLAGMDNTIYVPEHTPIAKVAQTLAYGGNIVKVRGNFSKSYELAKLAAQSPQVMNVTTTFLNPYGIEGDKTIAHEIYEDLGTNPTAVFIPVGAGPIAYGIFKGFKELCAIHPNLSMPRIIAVQAAGCAPIATALQLGISVRSEKHPATIASAISDPLEGYEQDGELTVLSIKATQGFGITVTDSEIINAGLELARLEGLFVEPASAAAFAGYRKAVNDALVEASGLIVCILTGHGLKDSTAYIDNNNPIPMTEHFSGKKL